MSLKIALILLFTHGLPILFFTYMATDVLLRNRKKADHILLSLISLCYLLLFAEEYVRNQVPLEYSGILSSAWLSSVGIIIPGLCFHFLIKFTRLDSKMPRFIYPYIFYVPVIFVLLNLATGAQLISAQQFYQAGMWKLPVYNDGYYIAMTSSIVSDLLFLIPLFIAKKKADTHEQKSIYNQLVIGIIVSIIWHIVFGYINYGDSLPPYPYLYSGIIWCYFLRHTMRRHDFLNLYDKRYEKLFNMNPDPIVLVDLKGTIKNANPGALELFGAKKLRSPSFFDLLNDKIKERIQAHKEIIHYETELLHENKRFILLVDADYVWVDNEQHVLLILRDVTMQKVYQEEIQFLAYHDPLTRLPNRRYFHEKLDEALLESERNHETLALFLIDLDKIKWLNDNHGHLAGDDVLKHAAGIIRDTATNSHGMAARMGGDEFIMYISGSPSKQDIQTIIEKMQLSLSQFMFKYGTTPVAMSIGVSYYPTDGKDGQALINIADNAMYEMKRSHT
ncbi:PAS domain S-box-containing protein/diguanylate cyclase (GGDEF) domain-containing protein [Fontibacillus panacisegetis]|uniref:PAS domain S-box-containing protein/diguanylate cyclase (GGDEF) domain-containing protein n=1 Tax=Fontibacillus panacisegetis TaxID=670482 RepID=A0A1G7L769_9BACL|nr:sensor domain-containing diguanylate cyclase [Fontibacillus panacisegetis]SDF45174.1 PAS domain S-box-containing protein/diguanylate cyclase (GGDEF) domain-containing protein [Fontibacillus panacisegetis]